MKAGKSRTRTAEGKRAGEPTGRSSAKSRIGARANRRDRAQTTLDFAIGTSVFLLVMIALVQFVPGMLQPFNIGAQEETVAVNRVADQLSRGMLGSPAEPYVLQTNCTVAFFDGRSPGGCQFSGGTLNERLGLKDRQHTNVTMEGNVTSDQGGDVLCWDGDGETLVERDHSDCGDTANDVVFVEGPTPRPGSISTVTARRVVSINGTDVTILVEMW